MPTPSVQQFQPSMAEPVARLIHQAFAEHADLPPREFFFIPAHRLGVERMTEVLSGEQVVADCSFVAIEAGQPISAVIARRHDSAIGWWRIATHPTRRRQGLASACLAAAEEALRATGASQAFTADTVDSRWEPAAGLLRRAGYQLDGPDRRNISMRLEMEGWRERPVSLPDGYEMTTFTQDRLEAWTQCRNRAFESDVAPTWFLDTFAGRPDFDPAGWHMIRRGDEVVAISGALACNDPADPGRVAGGMIEYVGVVPECRGLGLGESVVVACLNYLKGRQVSPAVLLTQPFRVPAVRLYEKLGFVTIAAWHRYVKGL